MKSIRSWLPCLLAIPLLLLAGGFCAPSFASPVPKVAALEVRSASVGMEQVQTIQTEAHALRFSENHYRQIRLNTERLNSSHRPTRVEKRLEHRRREHRRSVTVLNVGRHGPPRI